MDFTLSPLESIKECKAKKTPFDAVAIATIFTEDITAIASQYDAKFQHQKILMKKHIVTNKKARLTNFN